MDTVHLSHRAQELLSEAPRSAQLALKRQLEQRFRDEKNLETKSILSIKAKSLRKKIEDIESTPNLMYGIVMATALFKDIFDVIITGLNAVTGAFKIIPILGSAIVVSGFAVDMILSIIISTFYTISTLALLYMQDLQEIVKSHSRFYWRLLIICITFVLDGILPLIDILPLTVIVATLLYLGILRERRKEIDRLTEKLDSIEGVLRA